MSSSSVSFRIQRNTEDLASTIHTLSQRLVRLEQRLAALEVQLANQDKADPQELVSLENVERLLGDCRDLLALDFSSPDGAALAGVPAEGSIQPGDGRGVVQELDLDQEPVVEALLEGGDGSNDIDLVEELAT